MEENNIPCPHCNPTRKLHIYLDYETKTPIPWHQLNHLQRPYPQHPGHLIAWKTQQKTSNQYQPPPHYKCPLCNNHYDKWPQNWTYQTLN